MDKEKEEYDHNLCAICQKEPAVCGYDMMFCEKCEGETNITTTQ